MFVEGAGDALAVPVIVKRLLTELEAWDCLFLDSPPFIVGDVNRLFKKDCRNWLRWLGAAAKRRDIGAVLMVLDGDIGKVAGKPFCAASVARKLAQTSSNLSELQVTLGLLDEAVAGGRLAVEYVDRSEDAFHKMSKRATLAEALHQRSDSRLLLRESTPVLGANDDLAEARALFAEAVGLQAEFPPDFPLL